MYLLILAALVIIRPDGTRIAGEAAAMLASSIPSLYASKRLCLERAAEVNQREDLLLVKARAVCVKVEMGE